MRSAAVEAGWLTFIAAASDQPVASMVWLMMRGVHASAPVFAGTRIRVATVQRYLQQGYRTEAILEAFPDLSVADVEEARRQLAAAS